MKKLSARNQLKGKILEVKKGATTSHVRIDIGIGIVITSAITNVISIWLASVLRRVTCCPTFQSYFLASNLPTNAARLLVSRFSDARSDSP